MVLQEKNMETPKSIAIGSDHAALEIKDRLAGHLRDLGWEVRDFTVVVNGKADYPLAGRKAALAVAGGECQRGVLLCGTGLGMSYTANRVRGVRAALCLNSEFAALSREHNDANILVMPGRATIYEPHEKILDVWLATPFSGDERHVKRIRMIDDPDAG
jgi:ribose 5-phosphate isomerase B